MVIYFHVLIGIKCDFIILHIYTFYHPKNKFCEYLNSLNLSSRNKKENSLFQLRKTCKNKVIFININIYKYYENK